MAQPQTVLRRKDTTSSSALYISFDLGDKSWQISLGDDRFHVSRYTVAAGDTTAVASHILKTAARFKISGRSEVYSVYEAGRDGWWFHRWLCELGVGNIVVDPASIEVNRRARQAKTDRLDADKLLAMLIRHHASERVWSVLHEPSREDEDARREHRELQRLTRERIAHTNRIGSLLVLHNLRPGIVIGGAGLGQVVAHPSRQGADAAARRVAERVRTPEAGQGSDPCHRSGAPLGTGRG